MKISLLAVTLAAIIASNLHAKPFPLCNHHGTEDHVLCRLQSSGLSVPSFVPPRKVPQSGRLQRHSLEVERSPLELPGRSMALFEFTFDESVSEDARTAATYAAELWSALLTTDETIQVLLLSEAHEDEKTLASAYAYDRLLDAANSYLPEHYSPVAIVNRKYGQDFNPGYPDIVIQINSKQDFYFGTDGLCPRDKHDLVSVLLHELGHGLGFFASVFVDPKVEAPTTARWGYLDQRGLAYDYLMVDGTGTPLLSNIPTRTDSAKLLTAVTSRNVHFGGPISKSLTFDRGPKLHAPATWNPGSSISHLEEISYAGGSVNALMTPTIHKGEVAHDPGPLALAILGDLGWDYVWVTHRKVPDTEDLNAILSFEASIMGDSPLAQVPSLYYRNKSETPAPFASLPMARGTAPGQFMVPLQLSGELTTLEYYIAVEASAARSFTYPADGMLAPIEVVVGPDMLPPVLAHTPAPYHFSHRHILELQLEATDNSMMGTVQAEIWLDEQPVGTVAAEQIAPDQWQMRIGMPDMNGKSVIQYRFTGWDASIARNGSQLPSEGNFQLPIEPIYAPVTTYANDLEQGPGDFILEGFEVKTLPGFTSASLGTLHPYRNNGDRIDSYAYLRQPIIVQAGMKLTFDEIVLVEPGEAGTVFGEQEFWDYVTVEISTDRGRSWKPLIDGWDSGAHAAWKEAYETGIPEDSQNSNTVGTPEMFRSRTLAFDESTVVSPGDEILLRFYLYSDPYAVGWGWEIDNIRIGQ